MTFGKYFLLLIFFIQTNNFLPAEPTGLQTHLPQLKSSMGILGKKLKDFTQKLDTLKASLHTLKKTKVPTGPVGPFDQKMLNDFAKVLEKTPQFDNNLLEEMAVTNGYGYKTSNLQLMEKLAETLNKEYVKTGFEIKIPELCGISSQEIQKFLNAQGIDIEKEWKKVIAGIDERTAKKAFEAKKFPPNFAENLKLLEGKVNHVFDTFLKKLTGKTSFDNIDFPEFEQKTIKDLNALFTKFSTSKFMVRSTAKEDTDKLANAGGNESVANVTPTVLEITKALKIVVASYFGSKSATQRLGAGDKSLFDEDPFTPALVQRMIGETKETFKTSYFETAKDLDSKGKVKNTKAVVSKDIMSKVIPACGVMFTEEAEGGISKSGAKDHKDRIKTTGISLIQAAFGHNEGVVNSIVAVDTYYVDDTGAIFPVLREKNFRMAPGAIGKLEQVENPRYLKKTPALTLPAVYALKLFAMTLEHYYKKPMDVEFVVDYQSRTIYIVQARPIVHNKEQISPSYLTNIPGDALKTSVIGAAGGALQLILDKNEIIVKTRLPEALDFYQNDKSCDPKKIKCIVVKEMAPATSHEATTFRSELKPVLASNDIAKIEEWVEKIGDDNKIIIDTQQGIIRTYASPNTKITELIGAIAQGGWIQYPAPQLYSVKIWDDLVDEKLDDVAKEKDFFGTNNIIKVKAIIDLLKQKKSSLSDIIKIVKTGSEQDAKHNLNALADFYSQSIVKAQKSSKDKSASFIEELQLWNRLFLKTVLYVNSLLKFPLTDKENFSKRLFAINFLEALLKQQAVPLSLNISSFVTHQRQLRSQTATKPVTLTRNASNNEKIQELLLALEYASNDTVKENWTTLINDIFSAKSDPKEKENLLIIIANIAEAKMLPLWLNMTFDKKQDGKQIITEYRESQDDLITFAERMKKLEAFNIATFEDPTKFDKLWAFFEKEFLNDFKTSFIEIMKKQDTPPLVKVYGALLMNNFVDKFDSAIKAVKGSSNYEIIKSVSDPKLNTSNNWIFTFNQMVKAYFSLLETWLPLGDNILKYFNNNQIYKQGHKEYKTAIQQRIEAINKIKTSSPFTEELLKVLSDEKQMQASATFSLTSMILGNGQELKDDLLPQTLEDLFTLSHQSLINVINAILQPYGKDIQTPELLTKILTAVEDLEGPEGKTALTGFDFSGNTINYFYNYPLREHSAKITISFNRKSSTATFSMSIVGNDEQGRFHAIADFAEFAGTFYGYESAKNPTKALPDKGGVNFSWILDKTALENSKPIINLGGELKSPLESIICNLKNAGQFTFCTGNYNLNEEYENYFFKIPAKPPLDSKDLAPTHFPLITDLSEQIRAAKTIIKISLKKNRAHWLLLKSLDALSHILPKDDLIENQQIWNDIITILENLYSDKKGYGSNSELFLFRRQCDQRYGSLEDLGVYECLFLGRYYYTITNDNYLTKKAEIKSSAAAQRKNLSSEFYENVYQNAILKYLETVKAELNKENLTKLHSLLKKYNPTSPLITQSRSA